MDIKQRQKIGIAAIPYEAFIRRVFDCDYDRHGAKGENLENLMLMEGGERLFGTIENSRQFVKHSMLKALDKARLWKELTQEERTVIMECAEKVTDAKSGWAISEAAALALATIERVRPRESSRN